MLSETGTFVQVARYVEFREHTLVLGDLAPATIVITSQDVHKISHLVTSAFLDMWTQRYGRTGFIDARAVLNLVDVEDARVGEVSFRVWDPRIAGSGLHWAAEVVEGLMPAASGACLLSISV